MKGSPEEEAAETAAEEMKEGGEEEAEAAAAAAAAAAAGKGEKGDDDDADAGPVEGRSILTIMTWAFLACVGAASFFAINNCFYKRLKQSGKKGAAPTPGASRLRCSISGCVKRTCSRMKEKWRHRAERSNNKKTHKVNWFDPDDDEDETLSAEDRLTLGMGLHRAASKVNMANPLHAAAEAPASFKAQNDLFAATNNDEDDTLSAEDRLTMGMGFHRVASKVNMANPLHAVAEASASFKAQNDLFTTQSKHL